MGHRAAGIDQDIRHDVIAGLEIERWQDTVGPSVRLKGLDPLPERDPRRAKDVQVALAADAEPHPVKDLVLADAESGAPPPAATAATIIDTRGTGALARVVALSGADEGAIAVVARTALREPLFETVLAPHRLSCERVVSFSEDRDRDDAERLLADPRGGAVLGIADYASLPTLKVPAGVHLVAVDPPADPAEAAWLCAAAGAGELHVAWGPEETEVVMQRVELAADVRGVAARVWPGLSSDTTCGWDDSHQTLGPIADAVGRRLVANALCALSEAGLIRLDEEGIHRVQGAERADLTTTPTAASARQKADICRTYLASAHTLDLGADRRRGPSRRPAGSSARYRGLMADTLETIEIGDGLDDARVRELVEEVSEHHADVDAAAIRSAYEFAEQCHRGQMRHSGDPFITHPLGCARICAGLGVDQTAVIAALLHDTVEDTEATLAQVEELFGEDVRQLVDGVTKLSKIHFDSKEEHQAENYRKLIVAMSQDIRVLIVKLADRLHNMRTLSYHKKDKRLQKARETLEVYAPLAHRLGMNSLKWELEDLAFHALHPKRYSEIQSLVNQRREERERFIDEAGEFLTEKLNEAGINDVVISGRAKHYYSIYDKMTRKGKEFNEIYDLTAMRVLVESVKDCYGAVGIVHSLWQPMPGRFKDYVAMPKVNRYQSIHTTVIGPAGKPLEIQIRTHDMHRTAEFGVAAHWLYKQDSDTSRLDWLNGMLDWQQETSDPNEFLDALRTDLDWGDEVYVFTPKGDVKSLQTGSTPVDFAYAVHTDVGHQCVGAKVNGNIVPLTYALKSGDFVEILTSKSRRSPSRDWLHLVKSTRAQSKIRQFLRRERREDAEHRGRDELQTRMKKAGLPSQRIVGSPLLAEIIKELGFEKATEFYVSLGMGKTSTEVVVNKLLHRLKTGEGVHNEIEQSPSPGERPRTATASAELGIEVDGLVDVLVRLAKCCKPVSGDDIVGYISLGRGITVHREECPNAQQLSAKNPERFTNVAWSGASQRAFRVDLAVDAWDRARLLEDLSRTLSEHGANVVTAQIHCDDGMVHDRFTLDIGDPDALKLLLADLRQVDSVFDAYRLSPGG